MSEISQLVEAVSDELLDTNKTVIILLDGEGGEARRLEVPVDVSNPYSFDPSPFLPNTEVFDLPKFFSVAASLINHIQATEGVESALRVKLVEEYPPDPTHDLGPTGELITFRVIRREPGHMDAKGVGRPQRKATYSHDLQSKDEPNKVVVVESRPVDHKIEFSCWAKTNKQANSRALWLEKVFITHAWAFEVKGAERFYWDSRGTDTVMTTGQHRLCQRPLNFFLRFREFEIKAHPVLRELDFEISIDK